MTAPGPRPAPAPRYAIGVGCRRGCPAEAVAAAVAAACAGLDIAAATLFTHRLKQAETGLHEAAARLRLPLVFLPGDALAAVAHRVIRPSPRVMAATGVPSVAEAAALAGAGPGGRLVVPRVAHAAATCAVALGGEEP